MAITKIQAGALPADVITTAAIDDASVTHAKLHTDMDLSSKTVTLPTLSTLNTTGNVGIGETNPLGKLHVKTADSGATADASADELVIEGSGNTGISILSGTSNVGSIYFGDSGTNWDGYIAYNQSSRSMTFGVAAGGGSVNIDSSGNVGIGTGNPGAKLHVNGASTRVQVSDTGTSFTAQDFLSNSNAVRATIGVERSSGGGLFVGSSAYAAVFGTASNGATQFATNNNIRMTIDTSGNVLVGGTNTTPWSLSSGSGNAVIRPEGYAGFAATSAAIELNRIGSDGNIANFRKDGTTVGNIMSRSGASSTIILDPRSNGSGLTGTSNGILPTNQVGTVTTNHVDLGDTNSRFRNLYLSGNVTAVGMSTFSDITIGKVTDGQALIQMIANPTNGANTIHFGDTTSGVDSYDGYINYAHDSRTMQFQVGGSESMRILRDDGTGDGAVKIKGGLGLHFSSSSDASQYMMGVGTDNSYRSGVIFELQTSQGLWACGFIKIKCAAGRNGLESRSTAEYLYKFQAFNEGISGIGLVSSSGNTSDFTISVTEANANSSAGTVELKVKSTASTNHGTSMTHVEVGHYNGINKLRRGI